MEYTDEIDGFGIPRKIAQNNNGKRRYSYDNGKTWRSTAKKARYATTGERDDSYARAVLESRMIVR